MPLNIRIHWNAGTACVSECMLKTLAGRGLRVRLRRVGPSKVRAVPRIAPKNAESYSENGIFHTELCFSKLGGFPSL